MTKRHTPLQDAGPAATLPDAGSPPRPRDRQWEKKHLGRKVVYRGVDPKLSRKVKAIARDLSIPSGDVARAVIEYALQAHDQGDLDLRPRSHPTRMRRTLSDAAHAHVHAAGSKTRNAPEALWRVITTWRSFPPDLKHGLSALACEDGLNVPIGELITALLRFGLKAYDSGFLILEPLQNAGSDTPAQDGRT